MTCLPDQYGDDPGTYREAMRARAEWQADLDERRREREQETNPEGDECES